MSKISEEIQKDIDSGGVPMLCLNGKDGYAWFCGGRVGFAEDGSGWLANGSIQWDLAGNQHKRVLCGVMAKLLK